MASKRKTNPRRITKRIVSTKRHTTGYIVNGEEMSVAQTRQLAERGQIAGVRVVGEHIQAQNGRRRLGDLPQLVK